MKKSAKVTRHSSAELPREVSSWTPAAYGVRHRFAGRLFIPPGPGDCGFIESSAEAEFGRAASGGIRVPVSWQGHFAEGASVTFLVLQGPDGYIEAFDIEAVGRGEGLGIPSHHLECHAVPVLMLAKLQHCLPIDSGCHQFIDKVLDIQLWQRQATHCANCAAAQ